VRDLGITPTSLDDVVVALLDPDGRQLMCGTA